MNSVISLAVRIAFALAAIGMLKPATHWLMIEVAKQQRTGLGSLSKINQALYGPAKPKK
jgi:hypothetical protein